MEPDFEKLRDAAAVLDGIPGKRYMPGLGALFSGDGDVGKIECGSLACGLGWLGIHGGFGFGVEMLSEFSYRWVASRAFKLREGESKDIFGGRGYSNYDSGFRGSDKALLRHRIVSFLRDHGQPVADDATPPQGGAR